MRSEGRRCVVVGLRNNRLQFKVIVLSLLSFSSIRMAQFLQRWNEEFSHFGELSNKSFVHGYPVKQVSSCLG